MTLTHSNRPRYSEYVHVDISGDFNPNQKFIVTLYWLISLIIISRSSQSSTKQGWVALACGVGMILIRQAMTLFNDHTQPFYIERGLPAEPIVFLLAMQVMVAALQAYFPAFGEWIRGQIFKRGSEVADSGLVATVIRPMALSAGLSMVLTHHETLKLLRQESNVSSTSSKARLVLLESVVAAGSSIGSMVVVHGNLHNLLIVVCYAYDDIGWTEFIVNMVCPMLVVASVSLAAFIIVAAQFPLPDDAPSSMQDLGNEAQYHGIAVTDGDVDITDVDEWDNDGPENLPALDGDIHDEERDGTPDESAMKGDLEESRSSCSVHAWILIFLLAVIALAYIIYLLDSIITTAVTAALIAVFVGQRFMTAVPSSTLDTTLETDPVLANLDVSSTFLFIGLTLITSSFSDTGVPQMFFCSPNGSWCLLSNNTPWALVTIVCGVALSPLVTTIVLAATVPYASPYDWLQVSLHLSVALLVRSLWNAIFQHHTFHKDLHLSRRAVTWMALVVVAGVVPLVAGMMAHNVLKQYHFVPGCSIRLGECLN